MGETDRGANLSDFNLGFKHFDWRGLGFVHIDEFCEAVDRCGFAFTEQEQRYLASHFCKTDVADGVAYKDFLMWATFASKDIRDVEDELWQRIKADAKRQGQTAAQVSKVYMQAFIRAAEKEQKGDGLSRTAFRKTCISLDIGLSGEELRTVMDEYDAECKDVVQYIHFVKKGLGSGKAEDAHSIKKTNSESMNDGLNTVMGRLTEIVRKAAQQGVD